MTITTKNLGVVGHYPVFRILDVMTTRRKMYGKEHFGCWVREIFLLSELRGGCARDRSWNKKGEFFPALHESHGSINRDKLVKNQLIKYSFLSCILLQLKNSKNEYRAELFIPYRPFLSPQSRDKEKIDKSFILSQ